MLHGSQTRLTTTVAIRPSTITTITKETMMELLIREPAFLHLFMGHLLNRNSRIEADLMDQLFNSSEKRLARLLLTGDAEEPRGGDSALSKVN
jgi:CRP-like cAMP-binding protein